MCEGFNWLSAPVFFFFFTPFSTCKACQPAARDLLQSIPTHPEIIIPQTPPHLRPLSPLPPRCLPIPMTTQVDIPILNEATEQVLAVKAVDVIADFLEGELERAGIAAFFADVRGMSEAEFDAWVAVMGRKVNDAVDLPMLNEDQEEVVIELILKLVAEKFVRGEEKLKLPFGLKLPFT